MSPPDTARAKDSRGAWRAVHRRSPRLPKAVRHDQRECGLLLVPDRRVERAWILGASTRLHDGAQPVELGADQTRGHCSRRIFVPHSEQILPGRREKPANEYSDKTEDGSGHRPRLGVGASVAKLSGAPVGLWVKGSSGEVDVDAGAAQVDEGDEGAG